MKKTFGRELSELHEDYVDKGDESGFYSFLAENIEKKQITKSDFSVRDLFENFVPDSREILSQWHNYPEARMNLHEAGVETSSFSNITGQFLINHTLEKYNLGGFIADQLMEIWPSKLAKGERIPGVTAIGDNAEAIGEGQPYPLIGVGEDWIDTPEAVKRGMIIPLTRESIIADLTGQLMTRAGECGDWMGYNRELRCLKMITGVTPDTWNRKGVGVTTAYGDSSGNHDFDNLAASNELKDWTNIEAALLLFDAITDPNTGVVVNVRGGDPLQILVPTAKAITANRIVNATQNRYGDGASQTNADYGPNPIADLNISIVTSPYVSVANNSTTWYCGAFKKAFKYMQIAPMQVVQAPTNSEMEFTNDIVNRWKVSEWGTVAVVNPRYVVKSTN